MRTFTLIIACAAVPCAASPAGAQPGTVFSDLAEAEPPAAGTSDGAASAGGRADQAAEVAVLWSFPGPYGDDLRAAVVARQGGSLRGHLLTAEAVTAHLRAARPGAAGLACLTDAATCADTSHAALVALGLSGRVEAEASRTAAGWKVRLSQRQVGAAVSAEVVGEGAALEAAVDAAFGELLGQGRVKVLVSPPDATLLLNGQPWAQGAGTHPAPPGRHALRVEAPGHAPLDLVIEVVKGEVVAVSAELATARSVLVLKIDPPDAVVLLDGEPIDHTEPLEVTPGEHRIEASAPGKAPHIHRFVAEPSTRLDLSLVMRPADDDDWSKPHPDTLSKPFQVRAALRFTSIGSGALAVSEGADAERVAVRRQQDALGTFGLSVGAGWRDEHLSVDAATFEVISGSGPAKARLEDGATGQIEDYRRFMVRPAWVGLRLPRWRVDPYVQGGAVLAFDAFDVVGAEGQRQSFTRAAFLLGVNLGARFFFSDQWFAHLGFDSTFWFGERSTATFVLGGGWSFDFELPEWL